MNKWYRKGMIGTIVEPHHRGLYVNFHGAPVRFLRYTTADSRSDLAYIMVEHLENGFSWKKGDQMSLQEFNFKPRSPRHDHGRFSRERGE